MKTRTAAFDEVWANPRTRKAVYKITYKRRYWNGAAYVLEAVARTITRREIDRVSGLSQKYSDISLKQRIASSNVTIVLQDRTYKWLPGNTMSGVWRKDAIATSGYEPVGSEFTIWYGYVTDDDPDTWTEEYLPQFVGRIDDDPKFDSESGTVSIQLVGLAESKLESASAQRVGTSFADQTTTPASGDGANTTFSTAKESLWGASNIRVAGTVKNQGEHYDLSDLNDAEVQAAIEFNADNIPTAGQAILWDGDQWHRNKKVSELVGLLCDEAGIVEADRVIEEPTWPGVAQTVRYGSSAEWIAATKTNANADLNPGWGQVGKNIDDADFESGAFGNGWETLISDGGGGKQAQSGYDSTYQKAGSYCGWLYLWAPEAVSISAKCRIVVSTSPTPPAISSLYYLSGEDFTLSYDSTWKELSLEVSLGAVDHYVHVFLWDSLDPTCYSIFSSQSAIRGSQTLTFWLNSLNPGYGIGSHISVCIDSFVARQIPGTGTIEVVDIDLIAVPLAWNPLLYLGNLNGGSVSFRTKTATAAGGSYSAYESLDASMIPVSPLRQFMSVEITLTPTADLTDGPELDYFEVGFSSSDIFIKSADFTGLTCLQAIAELAKFSGMEYRTAGDGTFYFTNRDASLVADLELSQKTAALRILEIRPGYQEVRNVVQLRYGKSGTNGYYYSEYGATEAGEVSPTTAERLGEKILTIDLQRFIFANDAQVAESIARKAYEDNFRPKRRGKLEARIIPQIETSDKLLLSFHDSPLIEETIFGDPFQRPMAGGVNTKTLARDILVRIVGNSPDIMTSKSVLDYEEVLA